MQSLGAIVCVSIKTDKEYSARSNAAFGGDSGFRHVNSSFLFVPPSVLSDTVKCKSTCHYSPYTPLKPTISQLF